MHLHPEFLSGYRNLKSLRIPEETRERSSWLFFRSNCGKNGDAEGLGKRILELHALDLELMRDVVLGVSAQIARRNFFDQLVRGL